MRMVGTDRSNPDSAARRYSRCRAARKFQRQRPAPRPEILSVVQERQLGITAMIAPPPVAAAATTTVARAGTKATSTILITTAPAAGTVAARRETQATTTQLPAAPAATATRIKAGIGAATVIRLPLAVGTTPTISGTRARTTDYLGPHNGTPVVLVIAIA